MIERIPPHNDEAEKSVLGAAILSKDALMDIVDIVKPEDFYSKMHKEIFEAIIELYRNNVPVDMLTVCEELKKKNSLEMIGGRGYIATLSSSVPSTTNASEYAKIVVEKSSIRQLIRTSEGITEKGYEGKMAPSDILDFAEKGIFDIAQQRQTNEYKPIKEVLLENINIIDRASQTQGKIVGLPTWFKDLDAKTSGLQKSDLVIVAARPAMGKTAFALNIAQQAAIKSAASVIIFSMEMSKEQLGQRILSMESRVEMQKLKTGDLQRKDWDRINMALDTLSKTHIYIDDTPGISVLEMKNKCRRLKAEKGLDLIIIDYLQLMAIEGRTENRQQEISALSRYLKLLAREIDCPVIVLSQLSRAPEQRQDHRPILSDLRESGSIEQDADIVLFLYRDDYYNPDSEDSHGICEINIAKHRSGPTGVVELTWVERYTKFSDKA